MHVHEPSRRATAEAIGTAALVATVVGSGIMATRLTGDTGVQLLINALATVAALAVLIWALGPISGAHFNPVVTLVALARREVGPAEAARYVVAQIVGGLAGTALGNLMFELPAWHASGKVRATPNLSAGEIVATAGLLSLIGALTAPGTAGWVRLSCRRGSARPFLHLLDVVANPAVTIARAATDTFSGIAPSSVAAFIGAQLVGGFVGAVLTEVFHPRTGAPEPLDLPEPVHASDRAAEGR